MSAPRTVASVQATNATRMRHDEGVGVVAAAGTGSSSCSSVNPLQLVLKRPSGSLKLNTAIVISGMNR